MRHIYSLLIVSGVAFVAWPLHDTWRWVALFMLIIAYSEVHKRFWPRTR